MEKTCCWPLFWDAWWSVWGHPSTASCFFEVCILGNKRVHCNFLFLCTLCAHALHSMSLQSLRKQLSSVLPLLYDERFLPRAHTHMLADAKDLSANDLLKIRNLPQVSYRSPPLHHSRHINALCDWEVFSYTGHEVQDSMYSKTVPSGFQSQACWHLAKKKRISMNHVCFCFITH